jgi:2-oxoisovalerate dehydrogenase E1 component alpha subunit
MSEETGLSLHIPTRPTGANALAASIPAAGSVPRPPADAPEPGLRSLPYGLIRVLDEEGQAVGPWRPELDAMALIEGLRAMLLTRLFDERMFRAHRQGKTSFYLKSEGEEAVSVAPSLLLPPGDMCFPTYRNVGWLMARRHPLSDLCNQIFSNRSDPLKGKQLPVLYSARQYGFYSLSGNLGSRIGHAVGWAMASAYRHDRHIAIGYVGEGTTAEGNFHEAATFAAVYHAPVILAVANNQWAISSYSGVAGGDETTFAAKAIGYGVPGLRVDGNDYLAVHAATAWAAERARGNHGPTLIEFYTYRAASHSTSDDPTRYRARDEAARWPLGDPIDRLRDHLIRLGCWSEERHEALHRELDAEIRAAIKAAEEVGTFGKSKPDVREMFEGVFKEPDWRVLEERREMGISP